MFLWISILERFQPKEALNDTFINIIMTFIIAANITAEEKLKITFANNLPINTADTKAKIKDFIVFMRSARSASNISEGVLFDVKVALNDVMKFGSYAFILILFSQFHRFGKGKH